MPTITINAETAFRSDGWAVHLFVDGKHVNRLGPFRDCDHALIAAKKVIDHVRAEVMPTVNGTATADVE